MKPVQIIGVILTLLKLGTETFFVPGFSKGLQCFAVNELLSKKQQFGDGRKSAFGDGKESQHKFLVYTKF
jgi:hypothetical protein